jgi:hypothetical protein
MQVRLVSGGDNAPPAQLGCWGIGAIVALILGIFFLVAP